MSQLEPSRPIGADFPVSLLVATKLVGAVGIEPSSPVQTRKLFIPRSDKNYKNNANTEVRYTAGTPSPQASDVGSIPIAAQWTSAFTALALRSYSALRIDSSIRRFSSSLLRRSASARSSRSRSAISVSAWSERIGSALQNWNRQNLSQQRMSHRSRVLRG